MSPEDTHLLRTVLTESRVAALGTLQADGAPWVSMVPFVWRPTACTALIHVSGLAVHTAHMQADPRVSLMVTARESVEHATLALPRLSVQGRARFVSQDASDQRPARDMYLEKFPEAVDLFAFPDFKLVAIEAEHLRFIAGFGRAHTLSRDQCMMMGCCASEV